MSEIKSTEALCPLCLKSLPATIEDIDNKVWMIRECPEHGLFETLIWHDAEHYRKFTAMAAPPVASPTEVKHSTNAPCPQACGICTRHVRKPSLVEIEVTQASNMRCPVCFMNASTDPHALPLESFEDFYQAIADTATVQTGVQLTGGEPTTRDDLKDIIYMGRQMGFWGIEVNTNGIVIARDFKYLESLVAAGLTGIYLQFDGLSDDVYQEIRGMNMIDIKKQAIANCRKVGIQVVLAMTIVSGINDEQVGDVIEFALENNDVIAGVALQPAFTSGRFEANRATPMNMGDVINMLGEQTNGIIHADDIWPLSCSHPICDSGTYLLKCDEGADGAHLPLRERFVPVTRGLAYSDYIALHNPDSPQGSVFLDIVDKKLAAGEIDNDRGLSVIIMNYMDSTTMDLERLQECSMFVTMKDGRLIPFCSYQLTDANGCRLYKPYGTG
jgi:uncharacterized radical SAM superfamily Fe-S cluster-containing enzyme